MRLTSTSPEMTRRIASQLATLLRAGDLLALDGPLGAGKTCFVQGLACGLGVRGVVSSPSFVLAKHYPGPVSLLHVDAYRLASPQEYWELGLHEQAEGSVVAVEWADRVRGALPEERIDVRLQDAGGDCRVIELSARGAQLTRAIAALPGRLNPDRETDA